MCRIREKSMHRYTTLLFAFILVITGGTADAQTDVEGLRQEIAQLRKEFDAVQQQYGERLSALEARLGAAVSTLPPAADVPPQISGEVPPGAAGAGGPTGSLPVYGAATASSKIFNPDIAVIGNFLGAAGRNPVNPSPALEMPESEASFQAIVDPYARGDFFIS